MKTKAFLIISILLVIVITSCAPKQGCTADAKICPDGSAVGRNPENNCEFDPCSSTSIGANENNFEKVKCGGWDTYGEVVCECNGEIITSDCPVDSVCDSGQYFCANNCGACKCYSGDSKQGVEEPCDGKEAYFK